MNNRFATAIALLLVACGVLFVALAAQSLRHSPVAQSTKPVSHPLVPSRVVDPAPESATTLDGARPAPQTWAASETSTFAAPPSPVSSSAPAAAPTKRPPDSSDTFAARRQAAVLWITIALPLLFITFVLIVVLRRLRPPPMKHTGPSDTTDLWREAGRRMK